MSKYTEMKAYLEEHISQLEKDKEHYKGVYMDSQLELAALRERCYNYEKLLNKFMGDSNSTDEIFVFEGKMYRASSFNLNRDPNFIDTLTVEFVHVPIPENV